MRNIELEFNLSKLTITIDLEKDFGPSKTGKSRIVASTDGNYFLGPSDNGPVYLIMSVVKYASKGNKNG